MKKIVILILLIGLSSCRDRNVPVAQGNEQDTLELSEPLQVETNRIVTLLPEAREAVGEWLAYATAQNEIETMRTATGREIVENSEPLVQIMESLQSTMPPEFWESAVRARVNVLVTKAQLLHQRANKKYRNQEEIYASARDLIEEFDNFKIQLNELFLSTPADFEEELDREFEESFSRRDTILQEPVSMER